MGMATPLPTDLKARFLESFHHLFAVYPHGAQPFRLYSQVSSFLSRSIKPLWTNEIMTP
jgi:hypothetical protein